MALVEKFYVSAPGTGEPVLVHRSRSTAMVDMRHLEAKGFTPNLQVVLVPDTQATFTWTLR
jgi:hypothetical protein